MSAVQAQDKTPADLTGKWQLRTKTGKSKDDISTLDVTESGSSLIGTVTPANGSAMTISDGYYVGLAIKLTASGRQGLFSKSIEISGHVQGDKMILNMKKGNGSTYPAIAERVPTSRQR
jgi:hypothetical protein